MREVQVAEAGSHLAELIREVEDGESVEIIRDGVPVARLVPVERRPVQTKAERDELSERARRLRTSLKDSGITVEEILAWRHEGHRA